MEAVRAFNNELSSLYETRPPISRAKMANVTKCAIKAIKFYKHVVQSVEKFILKCKPEYKVPGLYVIDSIVRQSRHQFGQEKDVFAPRFTKNIVATFQNLFKCPAEERSKVVRVLNLWQKNGVFMSEVIQPLLDLAADPNSQQFLAAAQRAVDGVSLPGGKAAQPEGQDSSFVNTSQQEEEEESTENSMAAQTEMLNTVTQLLQQTSQGSTSLSAQQQQLQQLQLLQQQLIQQTQLMQQSSQGTPVIDNNLLSHIQTLTNQLLKSGDKPPEPGFNKKLLDFDYGESDEEDGAQNQGPQPQNVINEAHMMQQIQQLSQTIQKNEELNRQKLLQQQQAEFDHQIGQMPQNMPPHMQMPPEPLQPPPSMPPVQQPGFPHMMPPEQPPQMFTPQDIDERPRLPPAPPQDEDERPKERPRDRDRDRDRDERKHRRSKHDKDRSRSRTPKKRRRSRSRSRERKRRSRSRDRHRRSRSRDRERDKQREKERERRKKGLPPMKDQCLSICTTTMFIGKVAKNTSENELKEELEKYGSVESINMIPPRGCAFVCMTRRKEAAKAVDRMRGLLLNGSELRVAWAPGIGVKESAFKDKWEVDVGATYIPWSDLPEDLAALTEGGIIDEDTLPENLKGTTIGREKPDVIEEPPQPPVMNNQPQPPPLQPVNMPPGGPPPGTMPPLPGMMPQGMLPRMNMMPQMVVQSSVPPQMSGMPPTLPSAPMTSGIPQVAGQTGVIPLPAGLPPGGLPQVVRPAAAVVSSVGVQFSQNISTGTFTMGSQPMLAVQRPGFPPAGFPRFAVPPQGFIRPPPNMDPSQQQQMRPALLGSRPPQFEVNQTTENKEKQQTNVSQDWQQKQSSDFDNEMDHDERDAKPEKPSRFSDITPQDNLAGPNPTMSGGPMGRGMGMMGQMRPPMGGMGPPGGMRGPRPRIDFNNFNQGGPNMGGPHGPQDGQNRFNVPPNMMQGGPPRGFPSPGGPRQGFMGNRPPFQRFPGPFMRPGFQGPPGDMMRPPFDGPAQEEVVEEDKAEEEKPESEKDGENKRRDSGDRWKSDRENDRDGNFNRRESRRDNDWGGSRSGRGGGRDFGGRGGRRDFDRRDSRGDRGDRGDRNRDDRRDRGDRSRDDRSDRSDRGDRGDRGGRSWDRDRDREGDRDRNRDRGDRWNRDRDDDYNRDRRDNRENKSVSRKEALGWGDALEEMMKSVVLPPPASKPANKEEKNSDKPESKVPEKTAEPIPSPGKEDSVKVNGPEKISESIPNGNECSKTEESSKVTEKKEEKVLSADLEEGEIE